MENKLNAYLSDLVVFYHKLQSFHWYIAGHTFLETHGKLEEYYNMINAQIDDVAEVMLMNGYHPVATLEEFKNNSSIKEAKGEFNTDVKAVYTELCNDFHYLLDAVVSIKVAADEVSSYQISSSMDEYISAYKKVIWMIEQTMM